MDVLTMSFIEDGMISLTIMNGNVDFTGDG